MGALLIAVLVIAPLLAPPPLVPSSSLTTPTVVPDDETAALQPAPATTLQPTTPSLAPQPTLLGLERSAVLQIAWGDFNGTLPSLPSKLPVPVELRSIPDPLATCSRAADLYVNGSFPFGYFRDVEDGGFNSVLPPHHIINRFDSIGCYAKQTIVGGTLVMTVGSGTSSVALDIEANMVPDGVGRLAYWRGSRFELSVFQVGSVRGAVERLARIAWHIRAATGRGHLNEPGRTLYNDWRAPPPPPTVAEEGINDGDCVNNCANTTSTTTTTTTTTTSTTTSTTKARTDEEAETLLPPPTTLLPTTTTTRTTTTTMAPKEPVTLRTGDVVHIQIFWTRQYGQLFHEFWMQLARVYTSGLMLPTTTILVGYNCHEAIDRSLIEWVRPYIPGQFVCAAPDVAYYVPQRAHFVVSLHSEYCEPCAALFVKNFMLPRALKRVRWAGRPVPTTTTTTTTAANSTATPTQPPAMSPEIIRHFMQFGDAQTRFDASVSDEEWFLTLPAIIAIIKENAINNRAFSVSDKARALFNRSGFVLVSDIAPLDLRLVLINRAEVVVVTGGSLTSMMARLYGGWGEHRRANPLRWIMLVHPGYHTETTWFYNRGHRRGTQDGIEVIVTNETIVAPPANSWVKALVLPRDYLGAQLTENHLDFRAEDCYRDREGFNAKGRGYQLPRVDFTSSFRSARRNRDGRDGEWWAAATRDIAARVRIPGYGQKCFDQRALI